MTSTDGQTPQHGPASAASKLHHARGFRPDIEGLRALAVVPIVLNHVQLRGFGGGFIGVDVFFVISGYLITGILARDIPTARYSIGGFYRRRMLRIFPALFALLIVTTLVSVVALTPVELAAYGRSLAATILFVSNVQFYADTGYFTSAASTRPLLHTWSLAVEEQFYIVWPLLVAWVVRRDRGVLPVLAAFTLGSFALAVWMVATDMTAAFYLIPFRAWELGAGGLLALALPRLARPLPRWLREAAGIAGLVAIAWCVRYFKEPIDFPGLNALPVVLGTVAIIAAGPDTLAGRGLSLRPVRWLGLISYSLYLWHWPVIVFTRLWLFLPMTKGVTAATILVSVVLAALSYRLVEVGVRRLLEVMNGRRAVITAAAVMAIGLSVAVVIVAGRGFPDRFDPHRVALAQVLARDEEAAYRRGTCFVVNDSRFAARTCLARRAPGPTILLVGDSTAAHLWPGLAASATGYDIRQATMIGCPPGVFSDLPKLQCSRFFADLLDGWVPAHRPAAVMLAGDWHPGDVGMARRTLAAEHARGQRVILVGPAPRYQNALPRLLFFDPSGRLARADLDPAIWPVDEQLAQAAREYGATYISPLRLLCPKRRCRILTRGGIPLQFDNVHFTTEGSREMVAAMMPGIDAAMSPAAAPRRRRKGVPQP